MSTPFCELLCSKLLLILILCFDGDHGTCGSLDLQTSVRVFQSDLSVIALCGL